jgi:hypothetical protein
MAQSKYQRRKWRNISEEMRRKVGSYQAMKWLAKAAINEKYGVMAALMKHRRGVARK